MKKFRHTIGFILSGSLLISAVACAGQQALPTLVPTLERKIAPTAIPSQTPVPPTTTPYPTNTPELTEATPAISLTRETAQTLLPQELFDLQKRYSSPCEAVQNLFYDYGLSYILDLFNGSPDYSLKKRAVDCEDIAMLVALSVEDDGYKPYL